MEQPVLRSIRKRYHPLWRLRGSAVFRAFHRGFDLDGSCSFNGVSACIKPLRDARLLPPPAGTSESART